MDMSNCPSNVWNSIPPQRPNSLAAYIARITRNLSLDKYRASTAEKRGAGHTATVLSELQYCIAGSDDGREIEDQLAMVDVLNRFLGSLSPQSRKVFMRRYWYFNSIKEIANEYHMTEGKVKMLLLRTRRELKKHLEREGVSQ